MPRMRHPNSVYPKAQMPEGQSRMKRPRRAASSSVLQLLRVQAAQKNKAGPPPCFKFFSSIRRSPPIIFLEWPRLVAPPVAPPSDLDHTRPTDANLALPAALLRVSDSYLKSSNLSSGLSCTAP